MRTLRKSLALLLAVVMVLGLGAFTAIAAPSDTYSDSAAGGTDRNADNGT